MKLTFTQTSVNTGDDLEKQWNDLHYFLFPSAHKNDARKKYTNLQNVQNRTHSVISR
jgi:hypothetical protein